MVGDNDEVTADLSMTGMELRDEVSIESEAFDIENGRVDVDLSVSVPVGDRSHARRLLAELNLVDLVTRRLGGDRITVSPSETQRRIDIDGSAR